MIAKGFIEKYSKFFAIMRQYGAAAAARWRLELGFGFDFYEPGGVEEAGHDDGGGGGADVGEDLAVGTGDFFPVLGGGEVDAGAEDMVEGGAGLGQCLADQVQAEAGLGVGAGRGRGAAGRHRGGAGDQDPVSGGHGTREPEDGLVRGVPADALTHVRDCLMERNIRAGGTRWRTGYVRRYPGAHRVLRGMRASGARVRAGACAGGAGRRVTTGVMRPAWRVG